MTHLLDPSALGELSTALAGTYTMDLCGGRVRLLTRALPGRAVCAAVRHDGMLLVVMDPEKPGAVREARQMLNDWPGWRADDADALVELDEPCALGIVA